MRVQRLVMPGMHDVWMQKATPDSAPAGVRVSVRGKKPRGRRQSGGNMPLFFLILLGGLFRTFFPTRRTRSVARLCRAVGGGPVLLLLLAVALPIPAAGATADSFRTEEYRRSTGLDFLRAAEAYALGFTGAGVTLGIIDSAVRADHPELVGKIRGMVLPLDESTGQTYVPNWTHDDHGSHVAGIMAAARDGRGMHGVAFDANLFSVAILGGSGGADEGLQAPAVEALFAARPEVRIINNSWGGSEYPTLDGQDTLEYAHELFQDNSNSTLRELTRLNLHDKVSVFAGGNESKAAPCFESMLPRYFPELRAWVNVGSLDTKGIATAADGTRTVSPTGISWFSCLAGDAALWTVSAPGSDIYSLHSSDNGYVHLSGTSMAAPYVSGTLGLVVQAFPWMSGKQLADAVLTTADDTFAAPDYLVQYRCDDDGRPEMLVVTGVDGGASPSPEVLKQTIANASYPDDVKEVLGELVDAGKIETRFLSRREVFGQGFLDAGKAVRGIARLDANRMTAADVRSLPELDSVRKDALETFDTKGYFAEFSNDIDERKWDDGWHHPDFRSDAAGDSNANAKALEDKDIGLRKIGAGLLVLSGSNDYTGATVVEGGSLGISRRADGSGGELINSDVVVRQGGTLLGDGKIHKQVVNTGTVAPGYGGTTLEVGTYTQKPEGVLRISMAPDGRHAVLKADTAELDGSLHLAPTPAFYPDGYTQAVRSVEAGNLIGTFANVGVTSLSPTLTFSLVSSDDKGAATVALRRAADAYSRHAHSAATADVGRALSRVAGQATGDMRNLLQALDWSDASGNGIEPALEQLSPAGYDAAARAGMEVQRQANLLFAQRLVGVTPPVTSMGTGVSGGDGTSSWQAWAMPFGSYSQVNGEGSSASQVSSGAGVALGLERLWDSGLSAGLDVALSGRRTQLRNGGEITTTSQAVSLGGHLRFAPQRWDGAYVMGLARVGVEDTQMRRTVRFNGYERSHDSRWTGYTADFLAGGGKDWAWLTPWGRMDAGPLVWLEYSLNMRPGITEKGFGASALKLDAATVDNLSFVLGGHADFARELGNGTQLAWGLLAGWRHNGLAGSVRSQARFKEYNVKFESRSELPGQDALLAQARLRATHASGFFAQAELGAELFRTRSFSCSGGISLGLEF